MVSDTEAASLVATISAKGTTSFKQSVRSSERAVESLGSSIDDADDELGGLTRSSVAATASLTGFTGVAQAASASTVALTAGAATAATAIGTLGSALVALGVALGGIVTAAAAVASGFAAVIGTGILAYGEQLTEQNKAELRSVKEKIRSLERLKDTEDGLTKSQQKQLESLKKRRKELKKQTTIVGALAAELEPAKQAFLDVATSIGEQFIPLIKDAIAGLPNLIRNIGKAIGPLDQFAVELRSLGTQASDVIPQLIGGFVDIGRQALPVFMRFIDFISANAGPAFEFLRSVVSRVFPPLRDFGLALVNIAPLILELGTKVTQALLPPLTDLINFIADNAPGAIRTFRGVLDDLRPTFQGLISGAKDLIPPIQELIRYVLNNAPEAFRRFKQTVVDLKPDLMILFNAIKDFLPTLVEFAKFIGNNVLPVLLEMGRIAVSILAPAIGAAIRIIDGLLEAFLGLKPELKLAVTILGTVVTAFLALSNPITATIAIVGVLLAAWRTNFLGIRDITNRVINAVITFFTNLKNDAIRLFNTTVDNLERTWTRLKTRTTALTRQIKDTVISIWNTVKTRTTEIVTTVKDAVTRLYRELFSTLRSWLKSTGLGWYVDAWDVVIQAGKDVLNAFYTWIIGGSFFPDLIRDVANWLTSTGASLMGGAFDTIVGSIETALNGIELSGISDALNGIIDAAENAINRVADIPDTKTVDIEYRGGGGGAGGFEEDTENSTGSVSPGGGGGDDDGGSFGGRDSSGATDDSNTGAGDGSGGFVGLQHGGLTRSSGLAMLHPNEVVMGVDSGAEALADAMGGGQTINIHVTANSRAEGRAAGRGVADALRSEGIGK